MDETPFADRRKKLLERVPKQATILLGTHDRHIRNHDVHFPFYPESYFRYLTGIDQPGYVILLQPPNTCLLFCPPENAQKVLWEGPYLLAKDAKSLGFDEGYRIDQLPQRLPRPTSESLYLTIKSQTERFQKIVDQSENWKSLETYLNPMRLIKSPWEQKKIKEAASASAKAHRAVMSAPASFSHEYDALFSYEVHRDGYKTLAYPSIVGVDAQACTLHYTENKATLDQNSLILMDAGTTCQGYASDITRTFPNYYFTTQQRAVYEAVLWIQQQLIQHCRSTVTWQSLAQAHVEYTQTAIQHLGLKYTAQQLCPHTFGHMIGLDVHDIPMQPKDALVPGMCFTVEPGLYVHPQLEEVPPEYAGIGVRIEDMVLIEPQGPRILTDYAPKIIADIERCRQKAHAH